MAEDNPELQTALRELDQELEVRRSVDFSSALLCGRTIYLRSAVLAVGW